MECNGGLQVEKKGEQIKRSPFLVYFTCGELYECRFYGRFK